MLVVAARKKQQAFYSKKIVKLIILIYNKLYNVPWKKIIFRKCIWGWRTLYEEEKNIPQSEQQRVRLGAL